MYQTSTWQRPKRQTREGAMQGQTRCAQQRQDHHYQITAEESEWMATEQYQEGWNDHILAMEEPQGFDFDELPSIELCNGTKVQPESRMHRDPARDCCTSPNAENISISSRRPSDTALFNWIFAKRSRQVLANQRTQIHAAVHDPATRRTSTGYAALRSESTTSSQSVPPARFIQRHLTTATRPLSIKNSRKN